MTNRDPTNWWLAKFVHEILKDEVSTEVVRKIVETDYVAWHTEELSNDITDHFQDLNEEGRLDQREYGQSALSTNSKGVFEPLGIVHRISKVHQDDSTGFHTPGITDFLTKQDWDALRSIDPVDLMGRDFEDINAIDTEIEPETEAVMTYLQDRPVEDPDGPRLITPLEAILYMRTDQVASLTDKDVFVEYGSPSEFSEEANDVAEALYDETTHSGRLPASDEPLPLFPQHETNYRYDHCAHFGIVGYVKHIDKVYRPYQLQTNILSQLQQWVGGAVELSLRQYSDDHSVMATDDVIETTIEGLEQLHIDKLDDAVRDSESFKSRVMLEDNRLVFGINFRTDMVAKTGSIAEKVGEFTTGINEAESDLDVEEGEGFNIVVDIENTGIRQLEQDLVAEVDDKQRTIIEDVTLEGGADEERTLTFTADAADDGEDVEVSSEDQTDTATLSVAEVQKGKQVTDN